MKTQARKEFNTEIQRIADALPATGITPELFEELLSIAPAIATPVGHQYALFRAREFRSASKGTWSDKNWPESYSYLPEYLCKGVGRAHVPGAPVFYGALSLSTAAKEVLQARTAGSIHVSRWRVQRPYNVLQLAFPENIIRSPFINKVNGDFLNNLKNRVERDTGPATEAFIKVCQRLGELFLLNDHRYSSRLAHQWLYTHREQMSKVVTVEGIWYPPVVSDHNGANVALVPSLVDSEMYVQAVYECQISGTDPEGVTLHVTGVGLPCARKSLTWYTPTLQPAGINVPSIHAVLPSGIQIALEPDRLIRFAGVEQKLSAFLNPRIQKSIPLLFGRTWQTQDIYDPAMRTHLQVDFELEEPIQTPIDGKDQSIGLLRLGLLIQLSFEPR